MSIYKKFFGETLAVKIEESKDERMGEYSKTKSGLIIPKDEAVKNAGWRKAKVLEVSEELKELYKKGDILQILAVGREKPYVVNGISYFLIPKQDVIGIL